MTKRVTKASDKATKRVTKRVKLAWIFAPSLFSTVIEPEGNFFTQVWHPGVEPEGNFFTQVWHPGVEPEGNFFTQARGMAVGWPVGQPWYQPATGSQG